MVKSGIATVIVGAAVLFGYFYFTNRSNAPRSEKARQAAVEVGDAVRDKGVAGLVEARLLTKFGLEATRFLHAYYDAGRVVVYGLVPPEIAPQALADEAARVPGVASVELLVQPRPEHLAPRRAPAGDPPARPAAP